MFEKNVKLSTLSSFKIGGEARYFADLKNIDEAVEALSQWRRFLASKKDVNDKIFVLGGGTNILWSDKGFNGLILHQNIKKIEGEANSVIVGGGVEITELLEYFISRGLAGWEWAGGLPGTFGGAVCDNAGAFRGEVKDSLSQVLSLDLKTGKLIKRENSECLFGYRKSIFKTTPSREIILEAKINLSPGNKKEIEEKILEKIRYREMRHPLDYPNIGSIFKNVEVALYPHLKESPFASHIKTDPFPVIPSAYLISEAGLKGVTYGGAMVSVKHSNFIINVLNSSSEDVRKLIELVKREVYNKFNVKLEEEVLIYP